MRDARVRASFREVPRSLFLPGRKLESIYVDESVVTKRRLDGLPLSSSTEPCVMARMLDQLGVSLGHHVLEIGAGSGYNAALLGWLAGPAGSVTTIDLDADTSARARRNLGRAGFGHVTVVQGDGWYGAHDQGPFDRIEVTVGIWDLSPHWVGQLRPGGILLVPLWLRGGLQVCVAFTPDGPGLRSVTVQPSGFMRLRGEHAGPEGYVQFHGWTASLDSARLAAPILELAARSPRMHPVPKIADRSPGWFPRFLLDEVGALSVVKEIDKSPSVALLHDSGASLAVLDRDRVMLFGNEDALDPLVHGALSARPLDAAALQVGAAPALHERDVLAPWLFTRPNYRFAISEQASKSGEPLVHSRQVRLY
jgi:protein-L-isoaspartate(D-aspartate) O-methyltransferase